MLMLDTWEQTAVFNPADPTQKKIEKYAGIPGQYATYYFNRVPTTSVLKGPRLRRIFGLRGPRLLSGLAMPSPFTFTGLLTYAAVGLGLYLGATKTKPGRKAVRKVKGLIKR
jgi:hypothetical protein